MRALILTAGLGTRLRPLTLVRAKPAVPVNGEPLARRIISWLVSHGVRDVVLNLHHRPASIAAAVGDGTDLGARVRYSWEQPVLGSAGGPRRALPLLTDSPGSAEPDATFLIVNGDTLTDLAPDALIEAHRRSGARVTMALIRNPRPDLYGGVLVEDGFVTGFTRRGAARENFHFIGVQAAEPDVFAGLADGSPAETVTQLYPELMRRDSRAIGGYVLEASFHDIGTPADYLQTSLALARREGDRLQAGSCVAIAATARLRNTIVWNDVTIGDGARLEDCIVCDGVEIPPRAEYRRSAIIRRWGEDPAAGELVEHGLLIKPF